MLFHFRTKLRNIFLAGLLSVLPLVVTYLALSFLFVKMENISKPLVMALLEYSTNSGFLLKYIPGLGLALTIIVIFLTGLFVTNVIGKKLVSFGERLLARIPLVSSIYLSSKQFLEAVSLSNKGVFRRAVLVEYPRRGLHSIGFVTTEGEGIISELGCQKMATIFIPTTPNPTSGVLIIAPIDELIPLAMTVEEGIKLVVSGGLISPNNKKSIAKED